MITRTAAEIVAGGVLRRVEGRPPLTLRRIRSEDPDVCALALVGTAAGPLAGDDLLLHLDIEPGARASVRATGAHLAQGRAGQRGSRLRCSASLGAGASLVADPGPLIVCAGGDVEAGVSVTVGPDATLDWTELIVLGRTGEPPRGRVGLRWDVVRGGTASAGGGVGTTGETAAAGARLRPLLRQHLDLADPELAGWDGLVRGCRVLASRLLIGPDVLARTIVESPRAVAQQLADDAVLVTVLADDAADARRTAENLVERLWHGAPGHPRAVDELRQRGSSRFSTLVTNHLAAGVR